MVQARRLGLYEANDIRRSELIEPNLCVAKGAPKKAPDRIAVKANRRSGASTFACVDAETLRSVASMAQQVTPQLDHVIAVHDRERTPKNTAVSSASR